jgi:basic membrane protein A and related proteins
VMGSVSKTHKIGYISGRCFAALAASARAVLRGAKRANKSVKSRTVGLASFDDPASARQVALAMIASGVDVVATNLNTGNDGVFAAAKTHPGVLVTTEFSNQVARAPKTILTGTLQPQGDLIGYVVRLINSRRFSGKPIVRHIRASDRALVPFRGLAPASLYRAAHAIQVKIAAGKIKVPYLGRCPY